jgi:A/G-specific adenine glycosylase
LPWRQTRDPYAILVSEIMLQQTQAERVVPKYGQFLARFPTLKALAAAPRDEVIRCWYPLGYNRRAVYLHCLAQEVVAQWNGRLPDDSVKLMRLAGIGPYTARAVACFAFGRQLAAIDTNVKRVLGRVLADRFGHAEPTPGQLMIAANDALPVGKAAEWNQALMDLGATICSARNPDCGGCPIEMDCAWRSAQVGRGATGSRREPRHDDAARMAAEHRVGYVAAKRFPGSRRFFRGRIVQHLRELGPGASLGIRHLGALLQPVSGAGDEAWLLELLHSLEADGLIEFLGDSHAVEGSESASPRVRLAR